MINTQWYGNFKLVHIKSQLNERKTKGHRSVRTIWHLHNYTNIEVQCILFEIIRIKKNDAVLIITNLRTWFAIELVMEELNKNCVLILPKVSVLHN